MLVESALLRPLVAFAHDGPLHERGVNSAGRHEVTVVGKKPDGGHVGTVGLDVMRYSLSCIGTKVMKFSKTRFPTEFLKIMLLFVRIPCRP